MILREKIELDYKNALKSKDKNKISTYRLILSGIKDLDINNRSGPNKKDNNDNKDDGPNALNLQQFKLNAVLANGLCSIEGESPALLLKNVFMDKNNQFQFSCLDNKGLCDCISKISKSKEDITITDSKFTFKLIGTGDSCKYELIDNTKGGSSNTTQRRRLLQRGSGGIC